MHELTDDQIREVLPQLRRFALWLTRNPAGADDLVQSGLEKALTSYATLQREENLRIWLFSILYRQFIDGERRKKRYMRILSLFKGEAEYSSSPEELALTDAVLAGFASLPTDQRAILLLVGVEGLRYREVADTLNIPLGTVMSRLSRARRQLHELAEGATAPVNPSLRRLK
ncbi:sigma-70 family RNA polymerase sigma factor [Enterobacteriales bacterium SAP-6]|uniref:Sigma-70 family RNA polymerase sigma factor n=2 Tax=Acerihabitans arboris TaxID=2691583 RepID=A0A845SWF7_9GAMM|nr:sigma-70 family RNA polymerase sigma factor [Acerihabitans arboris]